MRQNAAITFESEETVVLKRGSKKVIEFCPRCQTDVQMIAPDVLSLLAASSEREIFRLIEAGEIHFTETDRVLVCANCYRKLFTGKAHADEINLLAEAEKE
jgi:hypothetical protein